MTLALSVDGSASSFPDLGGVAAVLEALSLFEWVPGRSMVPPAATAVRERLPGVRTRAVRHCFAGGTAGDDLVGAHFTSPVEAERDAAVRAARASQECAVQLRAPWLIVELGALHPGIADPDWSEYDSRAEQAALADDLATVRDCAEELGTARSRDTGAVAERVCRAIFELASRTDVGIAVATPRSISDWPSVEAMELILEDLSSHKVGYWHDCGSARRLARLGSGREEDWLDRLGRYTVGVDLTDCAGPLAGLPAGSGDVDFRAVRQALGSGTACVVRADPDPGPGALAAGVEYLRGIGY